MWDHGVHLIRTQIRDGVALVEIHRAGKKNAISFAMWNELASIFNAMASDPTISVAILTGAGGSFFCRRGCVRILDAAGHSGTGGSIRGCCRRRRRCDRLLAQADDRGSIRALLRRRRGVGGRRRLSRGG